MGYEAIVYVVVERKISSIFARDWTSASWMVVVEIIIVNKSNCYLMGFAYFVTFLHYFKC